MKSRIVQLIFLIITGLIVGWREWNTVGNVELDNSVGAAYEVGFSGEVMMILFIFLFGAVTALVINKWWQASLSLSSPNSV